MLTDDSRIVSKMGQNSGGDNPKVKEISAASQRRNKTNKGHHNMYVCRNTGRDRSVIIQRVSHS